MASSDAAASDPLLYLRQAIFSGRPPIPTTTADATSNTDAVQDLAKATHLLFNSDGDHRAFPLTAITRFVSSNKPVDLRSIYLAWQKKDVAVPEYIASTQQLNNDLSAPGGAGGTVQNLVFVEKLDLITWLEGATEESEFIKPLAKSEFIKPLASEIAAVQAAGAADVAAGNKGGIATVPSGAGGADGVGAGVGAKKTVDPRLVEIYNGERNMGDRNSVLRGIKATASPLLPLPACVCRGTRKLTLIIICAQDFSHVRKYAEHFLKRQRAAAAISAMPGTTISPALVSNLKKPAAGGRRPEPIILLSPSASSLLRLPNIKSFLTDGLYVPPTHASLSSSTATILHVSRLLPSIDAVRPLRFVLVDTPDQFKPDYWNRVVAVFTTGQTWQFKGYRWQQPAELFAHALGIYVGWRGEEVPAAVRGWGRGVVTAQLDKFRDGADTAVARWRDREVVEGIWTAIEEGMRSRGWGKDGR
ncbi:accessory factor associated with RNA polymerase II [Cryomyces antarcticus]|uniref:Accessory factor associated with RNA polymerase II n=1 Tax=Cryomyces antarcticus TaxID=329879 RepID=A0ABR0LZA9_9PEZI|nr:accessory factor associated with RNA polymerase II [Cryomyces antarcticus]